MWVSFFGVARVQIFLWTKGGPSRESMGTSVLVNPCFTSSRHGTQDGVATEVVWSMVPFHEKETTAVRKSGGAGVIPTAETHAGQFIYDQCAVFNALRSNHTAPRL